MNKVNVKNHINEPQAANIIDLYNYIDACYNATTESAVNIGDCLNVSINLNKKCFLNTDNDQFLSIEKKGEIFKIISSVGHYDSVVYDFVNTTHIYELSKTSISNTERINSILWLGGWLNVQFRDYTGFYCL